MSRRPFRQISQATYRRRYHSAAWLKKHGFTNGLWRLNERDKARENKQQSGGRRKDHDLD
jgi:hypothetical protein